MRILLHICCGVCAASAAEQLICEGHTVTGFFYNPNIHPVDEYEKRLKTAQKVSDQMGFDLIEGEYDRQRWFEIVKGSENEPEGGARCERCFRMRLRKTYEYFSKNMFDTFTTTLSVGPMKDVMCVNDTGRKLGGKKFISANFKKKDGFKRAVELSEKWSLYRQHYCGCIYSLEESLKRRSTVKAPRT